MSIHVIYHDSRLEGLTPASESGLVTRTVNASTPLADFFQDCVEIARTNGGISQLTIMAHGLETQTGSGEHIVSSGGYGIDFCREGINSNTVGIDLNGSPAPPGATAQQLGFNLLNGSVNSILFLVCSIADVSTDIVTRDGVVMRGNGMALCQRIAVNSGATVIASDEVQAFNYADEICPTFGGPGDFACINFPADDCREEFTTIDFGGWEGTVYTINPHGEIVDQEHHASIWRDSTGRARDPEERTSASTGASSVMPWYCPQSW